ncbi:MAG: hypothetical protein GHCLOJNM_03589 [bacterium]|nr:hypothetical protein [bacterium]
MRLAASSALILALSIAGARAADYTVGVYYYPWYSNDFHGGNYLRERLVPPQLPALGEYNDRDSEVIRQHAEWARFAGIDLWVASWWGPGSREDNTLKDHTFQSPDLGSLKIALFYETAGRTSEFTNYTRTTADIEHIADTYFNHPNYYRIGGRPVLFVYLTRVLSSLGTLDEVVADMRAAALSKGHDLFIIGDEVFGFPPGDPGNIGLLDAITEYDVYGSMGRTGYATQQGVNDYKARQLGWKALADALGVGYAPSVTPGFNDKGVREGHAPVSRKLSAASEFGALFRALLRDAKDRTDPDIGNLILVTSWNEWHEDTQIEPVAPAPPTSADDSPLGNEYTEGLEYEGYGMRYLEILREEAGINESGVEAWGLY